MDRLAAMEAFVLVAECGSFSQAAIRLHGSKSAISRQVSALEADLGARLFQRTTRALALTEAGRDYFERAKRILADVVEADLSVIQLQAAPRGRLRVTAPMSFGFLHLAPAIPDFLARYPEVEIDLVMNDRFVDLIDEEFDVAIRIARLDDSRLIARRLAASRIVLCASPSYIAAHGAPKTPADLKTHECICYTNNPKPNDWRFVGPDGKAINVNVHGRFQVNNGDASRAAAVGGLGFVYMPNHIVEGDLKAGRLVSVLEDYVPQEAAIYAVYPHARLLSPKVRAFVDFLVERYAGM